MHEKTRIATSYNRIMTVICPLLEYINFILSLSTFGEEGKGIKCVLILKHL